MAQGGGGGEGSGEAHLASLPSVWKASGLEPSFMNFMAEAAARPSSSLASALLGVDDSFSAASARRVPCLHFTPPRRSARGAVETTSPGPGGQQVVVPRNTHGSRAERREAACLVREGELHLLASLLLLRVFVSLSATSYLESLTWG